MSLFKKRNKLEKYVPKITVLVPAFNEEKHIDACITSIENSGYPKNKMQIILIDDGSTDNTIKIAKQHKGIIILNQNHQGKTEALNSGVKKSKTEIIVSLDADTIIEQKCIQKLVAPLKNKKIGATTGTSKVNTQKTFLQVFQGIEYNFNNLIRKAFTDIFKSGIWFFGVVAAYQKNALEDVGYFKKDTFTEDMDIALELHSKGYTTLHVYDAIVYTEVPKNIKELNKQRKRWWVGVLQSLRKNKLLKLRENMSIQFLYLNQYWWSLYALISIPVIVYQYMYWVPFNISTMVQFLQYTFNWFSVAGSVYVIYKIPEWGINFYSIFGVLSGIITTTLIVISQITFRDKFTIKRIIAIFFYFPYTIVLNIMIFLSIIGYKKKGYFRK